jgi:amino acid permease
VFLLITALIVAILVPSLSDVFNVVGGVASSFTSYIMPGLFYWRLQHLDSGNRYYLLFKKYAAVFFVVIGGVCAFMVPTVTFLTMIGVLEGE